MNEMTADGARKLVRLCFQDLVSEAEAMAASFLELMLLMERLTSNVRCRASGSLT